MNKVILNWQRPLWEGDQEVVKSSGRDEPMCFAIHKCVDAMPGICLYSYLYLKLAKMVCLILSTKLESKRAEQVLPGVGEGKEAFPNNVYTRK
jgi:hypothetical protein